MSLCRDKRGGNAIMVLETDEKVPYIVREFLRQFAGIIHITYYEREDG